MWVPYSNYANEIGPCTMFLDKRIATKVRQKEEIMEWKYESSSCWCSRQDGLSEAMQLQGWSYQFVSGQVEPEASEDSQYWGVGWTAKEVWYRFFKLRNPLTVAKGSSCQGGLGACPPRKILNFSSCILGNFGIVFNLCMYVYIASWKLDINYGLSDIFIRSFTVNTASHY